MSQLADLPQTAPVPPQNLEAKELGPGAMLLSPGAIGAVGERSSMPAISPRERET
jgi:hypothetical protein